MKHTETNEALTLRQLNALEALVPRQAGETMEDCGKRAGVSRPTLYRYLQTPLFQRELKRRISLEFAAARGRVAQALIDGACASGMPGQAAMQRTFWQLSGELKDGIEISRPNSGPIALCDEDYQRAKAELADKLVRRPDVLAEIAKQIAGGECAG